MILATTLGIYVLTGAALVIKAKKLVIGEPSMGTYMRVVFMAVFLLPIGMFTFFSSQLVIALAPRDVDPSDYIQ